MRKTFLTFLAATFALLAVSSCGKLEDSISKLDQELKDLAARVDKLEKDLNAKIEALQGTVAGLDAAYKAADAALKTELEAKITATDGKFVEQLSSLKSELEEKIGKNASQEDLEALVKELSTKYEELKGVDAELLAALTKVGVESVVKSDNGVVITFGDGSTIELPANPEGGVVTVVEVEGVKYWAVMVDGEPVVLEDAVFHPDTDLMFQVDENNQLQYSLDGGETWNDTWAYVAGSEYDLVTASYYQGENYVTLFIGGVEYTLPMLSKAQANFLAGKTYFAYGQTKEVKINVKDIKSGFVASCPKGWTAELDLEALTLTVTAPEEGAGAAEGNVEVWFLSNDGIVKSSVLPVTVGDAPISITTDPETNDVTIVINEIEVDGEKVAPDVLYGATPVAEFTDEFIKGLLSSPWSYGAMDNLDPNTQKPVAGTIEKNMDELVMYGLDYNTEYVIWAFVAEYPEDGGWELQNTASDFFKAYHKMNAVVFNATTSLVDADLSIELLDPNAEGFYGFFATESNWEVFENAFKMGNITVDDFLTGMFADMAPGTNYETSFEGKMSAYGYAPEYLEYGYKNMILPASVSYVGIVPLTGKSSYSYEDIILKKVETKSLTLGGVSTYTLKETQTYTSYEIEVTCADAVYALYSVYSDGETVPATDEEILEASAYYYVPEPFMYGMYEGSFFANVEPDYYALPGDAYTVVIILVDADGKSQVIRKEVTTKALPMNETLAVEAVGTYVELTGKADVDFTVTGEAVKLFYTCNTLSPTDWSFMPSSYLISIAEGTTSWEEVDLSTVTLVDGKFTVEDVAVVSNKYADKKNYIHAVVVDAEGKMSEVGSSASFTVPKPAAN